VTEAAKRCFVPRNDIVKKLNDWNDSQVIVLKTAGVLHVYRVLAKLPQTIAEIDTLAKEVFAQLQEREKKDLNRTDEMIGLITGSACFSRSLAEHFGDVIEGGKRDCGHCTWCLTNRPILLAKPPPKPFNMVSFNKILADVDVRDDARFLAKIAFGISSPRITSLKLGGSNPLFGSMDDTPFEVGKVIPIVWWLANVESRIYSHASPLFAQKLRKVFYLCLLQHCHRRRIKRRVLQRRLLRRKVLQIRVGIRRVPGDEILCCSLV
jgi:hypothetical protein